MVELLNRDQTEKMLTQLIIKSWIKKGDNLKQSVQIIKF